MIREKIPQETLEWLSKSFHDHGAYIGCLYPTHWDSYKEEVLDLYLDHCPFADIKCPTHISHGSRDGDP